MRRWHVLLARINRASLRERGLLFAASVLVLATLWQQALMRPIDARRIRLATALAESQDRVSKPAGEHGAGGVADVYVGLRTRELTLTTALEAADQALADAQRGMIAPKQMVRVLTDVLARQGRVQFVLLRNLPVEALLTEPKQGGTQAPDSGGPYLHPIELVLRGNYLDVLAYLRELESTQQGFQWRRFEYTSGESGPEYRIQFTTLSMDSNWLGV
jgi:MSHA biogenesis protein MshJ